MGKLYTQKRYKKNIFYYIVKHLDGVHHHLFKIHITGDIYGNFNIIANNKPATIKTFNIEAKPEEHKGENTHAMSTLLHNCSSNM